jgi:transposase
VLIGPGAVVLETDLASDPDALATRFAPNHLRLARLGLEAGPLSEWLVRGLEGHGFRAVLLARRHVCAALSITYRIFAS